MGSHSISKVFGLCRVPPETAVAPARRAPGRPAAVLTLAALAAGLLFGACGKKVDPNAPFQMSLNGNPYLPGVGPPVATVTDLEAGFSYTNRCTITFPLNALKNRPQPGLEIIFNPAVIPVGEEVSLGVDGDDLGIQLAYYPFFGGMSNDGKMLVYAIGDEGSARVRFDDLDLDTRRVQGVLLEAVLFGHYEDADGETFEPKKPLEMHLANFPFEAELSDGLW
jgi:hypothetical protein